MLAARRDQENLVHSHPVPSKQLPKTPGTRFPKTPLALRNDENAPTAFAGKTGLGDLATKPGGNDKLTVKKSQQQAIMTPMEPRTRAPLGNKTTNAKARTAQTDRVKYPANDVEKSQANRSHAPRSRRKAIDAAPVKLGIQADDESKGPGEEEEPEYAPLPVDSLPYESDVLPKGGLTFEGLKRENFLRGFYGHFHPATNDYGVSREEQRFNAEMEAVLKKAEERNRRETDELGWNIEDVQETATVRRKPTSSSCNAGPASHLPGRMGLHRNPPTISSRRAASALAMSSASHRLASVKPTAGGPKPVRRPFSALMHRTKVAKPAPANTAALDGNVAGEAASRTTIGYHRGRAASSMIHRHGAGGPSAAGVMAHQKAKPKPKPQAGMGAEAEMTTAAAAAAAAAAAGPRPGEGDESVSAGWQHRPQFLSIFDDTDDEELPSLSGPLVGSDDEDEEFMMKLNI